MLPIKVPPLGESIVEATVSRWQKKEGDAVAVKVAKEKHDLRFDIPCLGPQTLETCAASGISVLAFESGKSLLLEPETCATLARKKKISVMTVNS